MPRYFFHVYDGHDMRDEEGTSLPDWRAAQVEAISLAGHIIKDDARRIKLGEDWKMEVTDESGLILFILDFHVSAAPVIERAVEGSDDLPKE